LTWILKLCSLVVEYDVKSTNFALIRRQIHCDGGGSDASGEIRVGLLQDLNR